MNICIISASMRGNSQSLKVANYLKDRLIRFDMSAWVLDLHKLDLPPYDDGETEAPDKDDVLKQLESAEGYVFVSPEWDGMMSHGLISLLHYVKTEMAHKPVMLVGVSSGFGGAYPLQQMKQLGPKNKHYVITPEALRVMKVKDILNDQDFSENAQDLSVKKRADYALRVLCEYSKALQQVRDSRVFNPGEFGSGV